MHLFRHPTAEKSPNLQVLLAVGCHLFRKRTRNLCLAQGVTNQAEKGNKGRQLQPILQTILKKMNTP
jgi:hypothetical protein